MSKDRETPTLPVWKILDNAFMRCAVPVSILALAQFLWATNRIAARKRIRNGRPPALAWFPLIGARRIGVRAYDNGHSCASIMALLREHGIDSVVMDIQWATQPIAHGDDVIYAVGVQDWSCVAANQFDWADCLLRTAHAQDGEGWSVLHSPGDNPPLATMPAPWGVQPKPRSLDGLIWSIVGTKASVGHTGAAITKDGKETTVDKAKRAIDRESTRCGAKSCKPRRKKSTLRRMWEAL